MVASFSSQAIQTPGHRQVRIPGECSRDKIFREKNWKHIQLYQWGALNADQLCNPTSSAILPSCVPVVSSALLERFAKQPESQRVTMQRETRGNSLASQYAHIVSNGGNIGPIYSSPFGFHSDVPFSSVFPHESHIEGSSFVTQSMNAGVCLPSAAYFSFSGTLQVPTNSFSKDSADKMWYSDLAQSILNYSDDITAGDNEFERSLIVASDGYQNMLNAWSNANTDNWNELLVDSSATKSQAKSLLPDVYQAEQSPSGIQVHQPQNHQLVSCHSGELSAVPSSLSAATAATKPRMRWTPELHERFLDAVNQLGGSEKATPKGVLNIMKVEGLTICHVKSHLQKFRTARCMSDSPGMPGKKIIECEALPSLNLKAGIDLTEALRLQMEVQKQLHAQLEIQKKLQLQIEKQEKFLQMIIEKQCKPVTVVHASSTLEESTPDKTDYSQKSEQPPEENSTNGSSVREDRKVGDKWRMPESEQLDGCGTNAIPGSPSPLKHARRNDDNDA